MNPSNRINGFQHIYVNGQIWIYWLNSDRVHYYNESNVVSSIMYGPEGFNIDSFKHILQQKPISESKYRKYIVQYDSYTSYKYHTYNPLTKDYQWLTEEELDDNLRPVFISLIHLSRFHIVL